MWLYGLTDGDGVKFKLDHFALTHPKAADEHKQSFLDGELNYNNLVIRPQVNNAKRNYWASNSLLNR